MTADTSDATAENSGFVADIVCDMMVDITAIMAGISG
jgi:hypothetical protein